MKGLQRTGCIALCMILAAISTGCPREPKAGATRVFDGIEFQWCPPGTFLMGSPIDEANRSSDELQHPVTLSKGFWLSKYEATQALWEDVVGSNPSQFVGADRPVDSVSWNDVQGFLANLNAETDTAPYRLPTEAEWEYACRAGTTTRFYWGNDPTLTDVDLHAWHDGNSDKETHPVGYRTPNAWGLYDMSGNVAEWCRDWYNDYPTGPVTDPQGPQSGDYRTERSAAFTYQPQHLRSAFRSYDAPDTKSNSLGFRILREKD